MAFCQNCEKEKPNSEFGEVIINGRLSETIWCTSCIKTLVSGDNEQVMVKNQFEDEHMFSGDAILLAIQTINGINLPQNIVASPDKVGDYILTLANKYRAFLGEAIPEEEAEM